MHKILSTLVLGLTAISCVNASAENDLASSWKMSQVNRPAFLVADAALDAFKQLAPLPKSTERAKSGDIQWNPYAVAPRPSGVNAQFASYPLGYRAGRPGGCLGAGCSRAQCNCLDAGVYESPMRDNARCDDGYVCQPHMTANLPSSTLLQYFRGDSCYSNIWDGYAMERQRQCQKSHKHLHGMCDCASKSCRSCSPALDNALLRSRTPVSNECNGCSGCQSCSNH